MRRRAPPDAVLGLVPKMVPPDDARGGGGDHLPYADARILGQLLAAQNMLPVLPTGRQVAEFYAGALALVPGVRAVRVCFPNAHAALGAPDDAGCAACEGALPPAGDDDGPRPWSATCALAGQPGVRVLPLQTASTRYGLFVLEVGDAATFERYEPFIANLGNFLALSLENRAQQRGLERARDVLERRVAERTAELRAANARLEAEIDERRRAEAQVRELNEDLERRVLDRTEALAAANAELESFAYSASHDLRAPLRHLSGFAALLRQRAAGVLDAQSRHYVDAIAEAATRMGHLIDDLLSFSRMGRSALSRSSVSLDALVRDVIRELEPETQNRAVRWTIGALPVVAGDAPMLRVVMMNLLQNALKFTRLRPVAEIAVAREPSPDGEVVVSVRDNGVGFDMAYVGRLFGVFERLPHSAAQFEGTGIGLATVRRVIQRHGGRTWAEGVVEQGATFYFSLPAAPPRAQ